MTTVREFLEEHLHFTNVTEYMVCATVLMLYPAFGPTANRPAPRTIISQTLGEEGMKIFKNIFDNNNKELV